MAAAMEISARYSSKCAACGDGIREGDNIRMTDNGAIHGDCDAAYTEERYSNVCDVCWLTHQEGMCDR